MAAHLLVRETGVIGQLLLRGSCCQKTCFTLHKSPVIRFWARATLGPPCRLLASATAVKDEVIKTQPVETEKVIQPLTERPVEPEVFKSFCQVHYLLRSIENVEKYWSPRENPPSHEAVRERFIPITRRSIVRHLIEEKDFLSEDEKKKYEDFALALDSAIVNKYHGILQELKSLFDPINPDKDTIQTRQWTRRERLDNEFWLLQRLEDIMERANFHELPKSVVQASMDEHPTGRGVRVSVNPDKYDVLRFWALGKEMPQLAVPWYYQVWGRFGTPPKQTAIEYYKRVVVAIRLKKDQKLMFKAFKEVPVNSLEMLLPDGKIYMSNFDKGILTTSIAIATIGVLTKIVTYLASMHIDWSLIVTLVTGLIGVRAWTSYKNRRNAYLVDLSRMLYFKNISNNRGLLTVLVDRAEDESFKESLLTYTHLLTNRPPSARMKVSNVLEPKDLGGIPDVQLERNIEAWIKRKVSVDVEFKSDEAIKLLQHFGILSKSNDKLHVLSLEAAMRNLPQQPQSLVARTEDTDIAEGYDRDYFLETEDEYKDEEQRSKKYGWF